MAEKKKDDSMEPSNYWNPSSVLQEMERVFDEVRLGLGNIPFGLTGQRLPAVDLRDEGDHYLAEAELPGVRKDDVSIEVGDGTLIVRAERESGTEEKKEDYIRRERGYLSFYRHIPLPQNADTSKATAKMENGLLRVTVPKKEEVTPSRRQIDID